jgi:hypothetical protein
VLITDNLITGLPITIRLRAGSSELVIGGQVIGGVTDRDVIFVIDGNNFFV